MMRIKTMKKYADKELFPIDETTTTRVNLAFFKQVYKHFKHHFKTKSTGVSLDTETKAD